MNQQNADATRQSGRLTSITGLDVCERSVVVTDEGEFGLVRVEEGERLAVLAEPDSRVFDAFEGDPGGSVEGWALLLAPVDGNTISALRDRIPWLRPRTLGLRTSVGTGDRLGVATPGHARAVRAVDGKVAPIFAQQSIREMERTGRSASQVLDDATWGVFREGWREGFGADADHLKTTADIDVCLEAGYTFFTFDPGEHVDDRAENATVSELRGLSGQLPWEELRDSQEELERRYLGESLSFEGHEIYIDEHALLQAAVKYGRAVAHAANMYRHLERSAEREFEVEVSVDETETPTTHVQHVYLARELARLGVRWVSLAPRYVGTFEKGVDYIGDVSVFERDFAVHAAIARQLGPYKLSLHSGSDKLSIYPPAVRQSRGMVHLKTAGTSYLEALRVLANLDPGSFREIYAFSRERYEEDRASYHVSASLARTPEPHEIEDKDLPGLLEQFDSREILHVTFGSVLQSDAGWRERLMEVLRANPEVYSEGLKDHFVRHLEPFAGESGGQTGWSGQ